MIDTAMKSTQSTQAESQGDEETALTLTKTSAKRKKTIEPEVSAAPKPIVTGAMLRKKELIDATVERSGIKKKEARPVIEAMLEILGQALDEGREINLQPMGAIKVRRVKEMSNVKVMITRIRQSKLAETAVED